MSYVPELRGAAGTDVGRERTHNEDAYFCDPEAGIFAVIDGVGGQNAGERAALIAREELRARLARPEGTFEEALLEGITIANNKIFRQASTSAELQGMACVLSAAIIHDDRVIIGHVGDSRIYRIHRQQIQKLTHDHSPVGEREDRGELHELDAMRHARRNEVYRDVGSELHSPTDPDFIEVVSEPFPPDAVLLLCSDGLTDLVTSGQILEVITQLAGQPQAAVDRLIELALEAGGKDNVTVIVVEGPSFGAPPVQDDEPTTRRLTEARRKGARHLGLVPSLAGPGSEAREGESPGDGGTVGVGPAEVIDDDRTSRRALLASARAGTGALARATEPPMELGEAGTDPVQPDARHRPSSRPSRPSPLAIGLLFAAVGALAGLLVGIGLTWALLNRSQTKDPSPQPRPETPPSQVILRVEDGQRLNEVLEKAESGTIVVVPKGTYNEHIVLKSGVRLIADPPGEASIVPTEARVPVVRAEKVKDAALIGFRLGSAEATREFGVELLNSDVLLADLLILGSTVAGVQVDGQSRVLFYQVEVRPSLGDPFRLDPAAKSVTITAPPGGMTSPSGK